LTLPITAIRDTQRTMVDHRSRRKLPGTTSYGLGP
jgi:hypothetical protein